MYFFKLGKYKLKNKILYFCFSYSSPFNKFFLYSACVKGSNPIVGDRVLVEASYNPSMPFKWNATRIQVLPMGNSSNNANTQQTNQPNRQQQQQQQQTNRTSGTYNAVPPPTENPNNR